MKLLYFLIFVPLILLSCSNKPDNSRIYFVARAVPGANIYSVNMEKTLLRHTHNSGGRESDLNLDVQGNLFFTSNRVLPGDRSARSAIGKQGSRRQDLNVAYLKAGVLEERGQNSIVALSKTDMPESLAAMTANGDYFSFVRTMLPETHLQDTIGSIKTAAYDQLYVQQGLEGESKKVFEADVIIATNWSADGSRLVFSSYQFEAKQAKLLFYDVASDKVQMLLENPWGENQIDAPIWSPDGQQLAMVLHPLDKKSLRTLFTLDLQTKKIQQISSKLQSVQTPVAWSRDGKKLAYGAYVDLADYDSLDPQSRDNLKAHIFLSNLNGKVEQLTKGEAGIYLKPVFSPDDRLIAYLHAANYRSREASLEVMDLQGRLQKTLHEDVYRKSNLIWQ